jgi:glucose/arabinose dehydrogenase
VRLAAAAIVIAGILLLQLYPRDTPSLDYIDLPDGFRISVYADVPNARSLAAGDDGVVFVSNRRADSIYAVVPRDDGAAEVIEVLSGLDSPNGIAFEGGSLYVAEIERILRYDDIMSRLTNAPEPVELDIELPDRRHHGWRYIGFGPDGKLYVSIGAPCNICDRDDEGFGQIWRMNADGSGKEAFARGIRNSVGFTWHPVTGALWFTDNGRDMLGDDLPPEELNTAPRPGLHFGYPYCHGRNVSDPEYGDRSPCEDHEPPAQELGPHVAALGVKFYTGDQFPEQYRGQIFLSEHGSWNRSKKIGYRVTLVRLENGMPVSYEVFADGWMRDERVTGRPVDLLVLEDGSMLVSDDFAGKLYRIWYEGK